MAKTKETIKLENALHEKQISRREYGCEEITIGFKSDGKGDEIVDYMTMDSTDTFKCYEIKVTVADLKTDNAKSFYGDYNYLVISESLYSHNPVFDNYIPPYAGILCGESLKVIRQAKKKKVSEETRQMLKSSLLRSVYWKYENNRNAEVLSTTRELQRQLENMQEYYEQEKRKQEELLWDCKDYEFYYARNHQLSHFSLAEQAKKERKEYSDRRNGKLIWLKKENIYICPGCNHEQDEKTSFCCECGMDLRDYHE